MTNEFLKTKLINSIAVQRPNYPSNCFTLDVSEHDEIRMFGLRQMFFYFRVKKNTSVSLFIEGKGISCTRNIKANKFFFSGNNIELESLGEEDLVEGIF